MMTMHKPCRSANSKLGARTLVVSTREGAERTCRAGRATFAFCMRYAIMCCDINGHCTNPYLSLVCPRAERDQRCEFGKPNLCGLDLGWGCCQFDGHCYLVADDLGKLGRWPEADYGATVGTVIKHLLTDQGNNPFKS